MISETHHAVFMDTGSLEAQYATVKLEQGQIICSAHGVQWAYDGDTGKPDARGACGKCILELRSGQYVACPSHGIQPAKAGSQSCAVCDAIGVSVEAGAPALSEAGAIPSLGLPTGGLEPERRPAADQPAGTEDAGDRSAGRLGEGAEGDLLPPPLSGDGTTGTGISPATCSTARQTTTTGAPAQPGKPAMYPGNPKSKSG